jgi:hypothetical protein
MPVRRPMPRAGAASSAVVGRALAWLGIAQPRRIFRVVMDTPCTNPHRCGGDSVLAEHPPSDLGSVEIPAMRCSFSQVHDQRGAEDYARDVTALLRMPSRGLKPCTGGALYIPTSYAATNGI